MHYSVCAPAVFNGVALPDAIRKAHAAGAEVCEFWSWWDQDLDAVAAALEETGVKLATICTKFISLTDPSKREEYKEGLRESIAAAKKLNCSMLISQVGQDTGAPREEQHKSIVDGLKECAPMLEEAGVTLVVEPLNTYVDHKGYYLYSSLEGFDIVREINSPNVKLLYDIYHQQIMEGQLIANITPNIDLIAHFHVAGVPGRHEPLDEQEVNYPAVFAAIKKLGYKGALGLEYFPVNAPEAGLKVLFDRGL